MDNPAQWFNPFFFLRRVDVVRVSKHCCVGLKNTMLVVVFIQACTTLHIVSELVPYHKRQQMILDQSSPESLQVFSAESPSAHLWGKCDIVAVKMSIKIDALSFVGCLGGGNAVSICIAIDLAIIISLQTHPAKLVSSWCLAPALWCKDVSIPAAKSSNVFCSLLSFWHSPSQSCFSAIAKYFHFEVDRKEEYHVSNQHEHSLKFVVEKEFDHHSHGFSARMLTVYQSPVLYAWTRLNDASLPFMSVDAFTSQSFLLGSCQLPKNSQTTTTGSAYHASIINVRVPTCHRCQGDSLATFTTWISISFKVETLRININWCWACSSICNSSEHHILWYLIWEQFFSVRIKMLGYLTCVPAWH